MPTKWFHFGRWVQPVIAASFWLEYQFEELELGFLGDSRMLSHNYFVTEEDMARMANFVEEKITTDKVWFGKFFRFLDERIGQVARFRENRDLSGFLDATAKALNCIMVVHQLDHALLRYIEKVSAGTDITANDVLFEIKPFDQTILMRYHEELKKLDKKDVSRFIKDYQWVGTHLFMGSPLDEGKLNKELDGLPQSDNEHRSRELPAQYARIIKIGSRLAFYRSNTVELVNSIIFSYWSDVKDLGERYGLDWDAVRSLTYYELIELHDKGVLPENLQERKEGFGVLLRNKKMVVVVGDELQGLLEECQERIDVAITELRGMVACKGGTIRGIAKVVEESKYISKVNKGDILVANETTPDYIVGMKMASAIITNQGGITSHAAITSREMKIPCVIGTKIATRVLKDGDMVEVDANTGVVRKIA